MKPNLRRRNLIRPALQLKMTLVFMATSACMLAIMGYLCGWFLTGDDFSSASEAALIEERIFPILESTFAISMILLVPVTLVVGVLATFMVAGPLYRFEQFLIASLNGENPPDCKLRKGDELTEFCELLNEATRHLRTAEKSLDELEQKQERVKTAA